MNHSAAPFLGINPAPDVFTESNMPEPASLGYLPNTKPDQPGGATGLILNKSMIIMMIMMMMMILIM